MTKDPDKHEIGVKLDSLSTALGTNIPQGIRLAIEQMESATNSDLTDHDHRVLCAATHLPGQTITLIFLTACRGRTPSPPSCRANSITQMIPTR